MGSKQLFDGLERLTPLAGIVVETGTPWTSETWRRPSYGKWGSLWIRTASEVATASLVVALRQFPMGDIPGAPASVPYVDFAAITTNTDTYEAVGAATAENWVAEGWRAQTVIAPPSVGEALFTVSGVGASFLIHAAIDWHG